MELRRRKDRDRAAAADDSGKGAGTSTAEGLDGAPHRQLSPLLNKEEGAAIEQPSSEDAADAVVGAAVRGGSLLMLLALVQATSTFILNVLLQRAMLSADSDPDSSSHDSANSHPSGSSSALEEYGAAAVTLELISSTALFLAREPFRVALARSRAPNAHNAKIEGGVRGDGGASAWRQEQHGGVKQQQQHEEGLVEKDEARRRRQAYRQRFVNTAWISAPVGLAFAALVRAAYPWVIRNDAFEGVTENRQAASLVCLAAAVELMCEPLALIFQYRLLIDVRVRAESAAVLVLGLSRYLLVTRARMGVLSFGYAQLLHSATLAVAYLFFAAKDVSRANAEPARAPVTSSQMHEGTVRAAAEEPENPAPARNDVVSAADDDKQGFARARGWLPSRPAQHGTDVGDNEGSWVDRGKLGLAGALAGQSLLKHVLTEGDKIVLARATSLGQGCGGASGGRGGGEGCGGGGSLYEQGVYAIASGYGSLAARLLFQPLEEAARLMFSKLGAEEGEGKSVGQLDEGRQPSGEPPVNTGEGTPPGSARPSVGKDGGRRRQNGGGGDGGRKLRERMAVLLATLLKLVLTAGLVFVCFGFHYTETLLRLLMAGKGGGGGETSALSEVARVLSWYCVYVLFLAANGMCEAFACAVARGSQLTGMGVGLVASFAAFWALVGPLTARFGTRGLVMANAAGMACRVVCSAVFIRRFFLQGTPAAAPADVGGGCAGSGGGDSDALKAGGASVSPSSPRGPGRGREPTRRKNLWREVVAGAFPHPAVVAAMGLSSVAAFATSPPPHGGGVPWDVIAAAKHVGCGLACFVVTAAVFVRYEGGFLKEIGALWTARRRPNPGARGAGGGGAGGGDVDSRDKQD
ncbi:unnamed protein product [Scytosiphon promiscuus]